MIPGSRPSPSNQGRSNCTTQDRSSSGRLAPLRASLERVAHVVFPARHPAERAGTLTNHAGLVQRVEPAVEPPFEAYCEGEVLAALGAALGLPGFGAAPSAGAGRAVA